MSDDSHYIAQLEKALAEAQRDVARLERIAKDLVVYMDPTTLPDEIVRDIVEVLGKDYAAGFAAYLAALDTGGNIKGEIK
jgi:hypothetical protein